ncbi:SpoIIE family protein phosphatase [Streptomyces spinoverrucosus]|uniref:ATP-binding SpoIIE family protein phosphatase n=1 Tax=Streptomyces spinoverrucosus TaxID=284043 RepID=UPI0018C36A8F|nr:SpoIIE family protein phosphatase [Streptomyces spinoverrucosus]MBG0857066.1 SpoIIE family protein phosphatase [Streptomyces spinoverrucosus]
MDGEATMRVQGSVASPDDRRDAYLAAALRRIHARLRPSTTTAYLVAADADSDAKPEARPLAAAMAIDTPLGFTLTPGMAMDDGRFATAVAYRTDEPVIWDNERIRALIHDDPAMIQYVPYAMIVVSVPLRTDRRRFGAVTLRWAPPRDVPPESMEFLVDAANRLAVELEQVAGEGAAVEAPPVPRFIPESPGKGWSGSTAFLYQFQRLATELTAARHPRDIVATTQAQVVRPFGGRAMALCLAERGRLRVVGASGFSKGDLRSVDGLPLMRSAPETDAILHLQLLLYATGKELHSAYPDLDRYYDDPRAWFFLPLIADGQAVGCCVLSADQPYRLRDEELAVLMIMLGQVGQSLQRARAHELEHSFVRSMQRGLLPRALPHLKEIVSTARYLPATAGAEVGGDWYDMISLPGGGGVGLVIGDVEGHSLEAVGTMGQLRSGVRAYATEGHDPATVLNRSNRLLTELDTDLFATCCCLWLDLETGTATLATAGHLAPVLMDAQGRVTTPYLPVGPPLGVDRETVYQQTETSLAPGSIIACYTDGLLDRRHRGVDDGLERLRRTLVDGRGEDLEVLADRLVGDARPQAQRDDDMALLLVRYDGVREGPHRRVARVFVQRRDLQHVRRLRHFLQDLLPGWGLAVLLDDVELLITEVVTNALIHADTEVDVRLRGYPDRLRVEVRDSDPRPPVLVANLGPGEVGDAEAESGRGMLIVDVLASAWGSSPAGRGKTTWFELGVGDRSLPFSTT